MESEILKRLIDEITFLKERVRKLEMLNEEIVEEEEELDDDYKRLKAPKTERRRPTAQPPWVKIKF